MLKGLRKMFLPRSRYISVINVNDAYIQIAADIKSVHSGQAITPAPVRKRAPYRVYVLDFQGDIFAKQSHGLSQEISAILATADPKLDEVLIRVESAGGAVHSYGYAASQIARLKQAGIKTTVAIDRIAASGGYMMACVADKIISAPFAIVGSIGVVAELPNFNKIITDYGVDYKQYIAGKYKRTVGTWTPITEEGEAKFIADLQATYELFKSHVATYRPHVSIEEVATGEHWYGSQALQKGLVDEVKTSDEWIVDKIIRGNSEVLKLAYIADKPWGERVRGAVVATVESIFHRLLTTWTHMRFMG